MTNLPTSRRGFNRSCLFSLLAAAAAVSGGPPAVAQPAGTAKGATRRDVLWQRLPGEPERDLTVIEVTYSPGAGSPPHVHANGVAAFVISGAIASKVGNEPERTYHAGEAWYEPPGAVHRVSRNASSSEPATLLAIYIARRAPA